MLFRSLDASVNALETHDIALDASVNALETHDIVLDDSVNALETHDIVLDASVNALEVHDIVLDASVNALETHDIALDVSVNALETHDIVLDVSVNSLGSRATYLETHDIVLDTSMNDLEENKAPTQSPTFSGTVNIEDLLVSGNVNVTGEVTTDINMTAKNYLIDPENYNSSQGGVYGFINSNLTTSTDGLNLGGDYGRIGMSIVNEQESTFVNGSLQFHTRHNTDNYRTPMTIKYNGNIGIGTNSPEYPLHVEYNNGSLTAPTNFFENGMAYVGAKSAFVNISILATGDILSGGGFAAFSDIRIKDNIVDVVDSSSLEIIRQLKPTKYTYKDVVNKGSEVVWGFIAQEVADILPYAVYQRTETIPNIYEFGRVSGVNNDIITLSSLTTAEFDSDASDNLYTTLELRTVLNVKETVEIIEVHDNYTFKVNKDLSKFTGSVDSSGIIISETQEEIQYDASGNELLDASGNVVKITKTIYPGNDIFIYGQKVDDFNVLKKEAIWTVSTAALQEVDRQLQNEKQKTITLENKVDDLLARVTALENP